MRRSTEGNTGPIANRSEAQVSMRALRSVSSRRWIVQKVLTWLARRRYVTVTSLVLWLLLRREKKKNRNIQTRQYRALFIPKEGFNQDIFDSLGRSDEFDLYSLHRIGLKACAAGILSPVLDDNFYVTDIPAINAAKIEYRRFLRAVWLKLSRLKHFDVVLTGNFGYYAEQEFAAALQELGTPFIALHKENLKSPGRVEFFSHIYRARRGSFQGRKILVYNSVERKVQLQAGVALPECITVCGMPRLDRIHRWRREHAGESIDCAPPRVLFFAFTMEAGLPRIQRKAHTGVASNREFIDMQLEELSWRELMEGYYRAIFQLARENPDIRVTVKAKASNPQCELMQDVFWERDRPDNLHIVVGGDPFEQIVSSNVICGFNTTALLECIAAGMPVIIPRFAEALDPAFRKYIVDLGDAAEYAASSEDIVSKLTARARVPWLVSAELQPARLRVLDYWCGNADGHAGERVLLCVLDEIKEAVLKEI